MKSLIIGLNWLGDVVMSLPAIAAVAKEHDTHILTRPHLADVYRLSGIDLTLHLVNSKEFFFNLIKDTAEIRALHPDFALIFPNSLRASVLAKMCGANQTVGYKTQFRDLFLTHGINLPPNYRELHESVLYARLLKEIGITDVEYSFSPQKFESNYFKEMAAMLGLDLKRPFVVIAPGAAFGAAKRWPAAKFAQFMQILSEKEPETQLVVTAGAGEAPIVEEIRQKSSSTFINATGKTNLTQLACLLKHAQLLVANDSGTMHLAALYSTPTVVPVGPTDMTRTGALNAKFKAIIANNCPQIPCRQRSCPIKTHVCMQSITAEMIYEKSLELRR